MKYLFLVFSLFLCSGCGTLFTRCGDNGNVIGKYPYSAVGKDIDMIASVESGVGYTILLIAPSGLISLPIDIVVDTVLLPADLIAWPFGLSKDTSNPLSFGF